MPKDKKKKKQKRQIDEDIGKIDIRKVTDEEWDDFEEYYIEAVQNIEVPTDLNARDILRINAEVDEVYSGARFDYGFAKKMSERYQVRLSNAKKQSKLVFSKQSGQTNEDREALILQFLETSPLKGDKEPLITLVERWRERELFMEAVIDNLVKKTDKMINGNGALKLDAQGRGDTGR
jgi:hypothetical protein